MLLFELNYNPYPFKHASSRDTVDIYTFLTESGLTYYVNFVISETWQEQWLDINFYVVERPGEHSKMKITNTGDAYRVLSTVLSIMNSHFISPSFKAKKLKYIDIRADNNEPSRVKLYNRALPKIKIPGFEYDKSFDNGDFTLYTWAPL